MEKETRIEIKNIIARDDTVETEYIAKIIGETSAGLTALEIYKSGNLIWSMDFFELGASNTRYIEGLREIYDAAEDCGDVESWGEVDESPTAYSNMETAWIVAEYSLDAGWQFSDPRNDGQSWDFIKQNSDRVPDSVVAAWEAKLG